MEAIGNNAGFGFSAKPNVVRGNRAPYRDPYREYVKIAPQNIMNDRRVVRGNTFAALVIPVNMQPDPGLIEKQKQEQMMKRQRQEQLRKRKEEEFKRQKVMEDEQQRQQMMELQNMNPWEELDDYDNMMEENQLEPDYYIDRPPSPQFVPHHEGDNKKIQVEDKDIDLFDYELEVEPILQVLVGKALEEAQIEVIEDYEEGELAKHKKMFMQLKDAELMETQRMEAARKRRIDETERRNLQQRTAKNQRIWAERKVIARQMGKEFLMLFKRNSMQILVDQGLLRRPRDFSISSHFVPQLYGQIAADLQAHREQVETIDSILNMTMRQQAKTHRESMIKEFKRREENKKEQIRKQKQIEDERRKRKEERAAARERYRIQQLLEKIQSTIIASASLEDYNPQIKIYDVRDPEGRKDGIFLIGGFIGELIITFTCLNDYILANPQNQNFTFTQDTIENYLKDLLIHENFADGILTLHLARDPSIREKHQNQNDEDQIERLELDDDTFMRFSLTKSNITDYGLCFLFEVIKDLVISKEFIETLYKVIIKIARTKLKSLQQIPEMPVPDEAGNEPSEEEKQAVTKKIEEVTKQNLEAEKINEEILKIQSKVKIAFRPPVESSQRNECGLMRVNNYREQKPEEGAEAVVTEQIQQQQPPMIPTHSKNPSKTTSIDDSKNKNNTSRDHQDDIGTLDSFVIEEIPPKMILVDPSTSDKETNLIVYHSEAQFAVRKLIIEVAKRHFKELEKLNLNAVLGHTAQKSKQLDERFEDHIIRTLKFGRGCQHNDRNLRITWKTFIQN